MTRNDVRAEERQALDRLLEAYGADRTRWPARERLRFAGLIGEDDAARRLLAEAAALDSLLDRAPRASEAREHALQERIMAAALRAAEPRLEVVAGSVAAPAGRPRLYSIAASMRKAPMGREWPAAALLAASLVLGVFLGSAGTLSPAMQEVAEATGLGVTVDGSQVALGEDILAYSDEDLL
jgi:hypothetical protein